MKNILDYINLKISELKTDVKKNKHKIYTDPTVIVIISAQLAVLEDIKGKVENEISDDNNRS